jgi:hypothetical protein
VVAVSDASAPRTRRRGMLETRPPDPDEATGEEPPPEPEDCKEKAASLERNRAVRTDRCRVPQCHSSRIVDRVRTAHRATPLPSYGDLRAPTCAVRSPFEGRVRAHVVPPFVGVTLPGRRQPSPLVLRHGRSRLSPRAAALPPSSAAVSPLASPLHGRVRKSRFSAPSWGAHSRRLAPAKRR